MMTDAVECRALDRGYGSLEVLRGLNMVVATGSIYGLLGPSGCGKTTLLKVLLGRLVPWGGSALALGSTPGEHGAPVPGPAVGYAPQELALYEDLSIGETLRFHGQLQLMDRTQVAQRQAWLLEFLDLPSAERVVGKLSGGQKRRVSLAVALLHEPQLLLLDEPTVGVDPELRARIWDHLRTIADSGTAVILTTHYIDEAAQADSVGLMRNGRLLAEGPPAALMEPHGHVSLEQTFLLLCRREGGESGLAATPNAEAGDVP